MEIRLNTTRSNIHIYLWCTNFRFNCTKQKGCQQGKDEITTCFKSQKILLKWNLYDFHQNWSATTKIWLNALPMLLIQERKMELNWNLMRSVWFLNEIENPPQKNMTHRPPVDNNANMRRIANTTKVKSVWFWNKTDQQWQNVQNDSWSTPCQCCRYQKDCQHSRVTVRVTPAHSSPVICKFFLISNTSLQYSICRTNFKYCGRFASNIYCLRKRRKAKSVQSNFFILFSPS